MSVGAIPEPIAEIVNAEELRIVEERKENEEKKEREKNLRSDRGRAYIDQYVDSKLALVPEYLRPFYLYLRSDRSYEDLALAWGAENENSDIGLDLVFYVPGLAPLVLEVKTGVLSCYIALSNDEDDCAAWGDWPNACRRHKRPETVLAFAKEEFEKYQEIERKYEEDRERVRLQHVAKQAKAFEENAINAAIEEVEKSEEWELFNAIKHDPVAVQLLKAFVLTQQERNSFQQQIEWFS